MTPSQRAEFEGGIYALVEALRLSEDARVISKIGSAVDFNDVVARMEGSVTYALRAFLNAQLPLRFHKEAVWEGVLNERLLLLRAFAPSAPQDRVTKLVDEVLSMRNAIDDLAELGRTGE